jgi:parallel beta-helix repeat protein
MFRCRFFLGLVLLLLAPLSLGEETPILHVPEEYASLKEAVAAAPPGSTISLAPGSYEGNLVIDKDLIIEGSGRLEVLLTPEDGEQPIISVQGTAELTLRGVTLWGFKGFALFFLERASAGISVEDESSLVIESSILFALEEGILAGDQAQVTVRNSVFLMNRIGVGLKGFAQATIEYSSFTENERCLQAEESAEFSLSRDILRGGFPLLLQGSAKAFINETTISQAEVGIGLGDEAHATVEGSEIHHSARGVKTDNRSSSEIRRTRFHDNSTAVFVTDNSRVILEWNRITDNDTGVETWALRDETPRVELQGNTITDNETGVKLDKGSEAVLEGNIIEGNRGCGVESMNWPIIAIASEAPPVSGGDNRMRDNGMDLCGPLLAGLRLPLVPQTDRTSLIVPDDYPTIQEAVDALAPGGTVRIRSGEYHGGVLVWKSLTLEGEEGVSLDNVVDIDVPVIAVLPEAEATIDGLTIKGGVGLRGWGAEVTVHESLFTSRFNSITVSGTTLHLEGNSFGDNYWGSINVVAGSEASIKGNRITGLGQGTGIRISDSKATVEGNSVQGIGPVLGAGIGVEGSSEALILHNSISDTDNGISILRSAQATVKENTVSHCLKGIYAESETLVIIESNRLHDNSLGIKLYGSPQATVQGNDISENEGTGVLLAKEAVAEIVGNRIVGNGGWGIAVWTKDCFPDDKYAKKEFTGEATGGENEIHDNALGDLCGVPESLIGPPPPEGEGPPPPGLE